MGKSLVFTPGCDWKIDRHILFVEYDTVTGEHTSNRFDLSAETEYIAEGYKTLSFDEISKPDSKLHYSIRRIVYFEKECNSMTAFIRGCKQTKLFIPTRIDFDTIKHVPKESPDADSDRVKMINQRIARATLNSTYGIVSRDWADVLADSARYIHMQQSRCSGKTLWLSSATSFDDSPMCMLREEYLKAIGREEDEKLGSWLKQPPTPYEFIADDLEDCEKGVPNTRLIDPNALYFQDTTTGEMKPYEGVKNITPTTPNGYFDTDMAMTREELQYCLNDVAVTEKLFKEEQIMRFDSCKPTIKNVIFNDPATIVMWSDGTKTVVKCGENDTFDPEKGVAMCCMKKLLGTNKTGSNYLNKVQEYFDAYDEDYTEECKTIGEILKEIWGDAFGPTHLPVPDVNTGAMDIPPEVTVEKEFEAVTSNDWTAVPADENTTAEEDGE